MKSKTKKISEIHNLLIEESALLEDSLRLEKEKRHAIIGARSLKIDELCQEQEKLLGTLAEYEYEKKILTEDLSMENHHNLSHLLDYSKNVGYEKHSMLKIVCESYREFALSLKDEVKKNQELLVKTSQSIQRILGGLQNEIKSESGPAYSPVNNQKKSISASMLINANA